jgi:mRNA-degrading endonuclease RelE of RelBE toxin-antitoxin system
MSPPPRYSLAFRPAALRSLRKLDRQVIRRIKDAAERYVMIPGRPG